MYARRYQPGARSASGHCIDADVTVLSLSSAHGEPGRERIVCLSPSSPSYHLVFGRDAGEMARKEIRRESVRDGLSLHPVLIETNR